MANGFTKVRNGHALTPVHTRQKRDTCSSGGFYKSPTAQEVVASDSTLNISWDTSCMNTSEVDIYLYAPNAENSLIHEWENVDFNYGSYNTTLTPSWWNSTATVSLQLLIIQAGTPLFLRTLPAGPVFNATYKGSSSGSGATSVVGTVTDVNNAPGANKHGLSKGSVAAVVIVLLLLAGAVAAGFHIRRSRARGKGKRQRFSVAVDKRMSTISSDWKSVTTAGATAAIRNSVMISEDGVGKRSSSFSFGGIRPSSTIALESGQAGVGAQGLQMSEKTSVDLTAPHMAQLRPRVRTSTFTAADRASRVSRVSFAPDTRPSSEWRGTRAFHTGYVPPLPEVHVKESGELSPTQAAGPLDLTAEDIRSRMAGQDTPSRGSMDAMMPALSMMRTGGERSGDDDDMLISDDSSRSPPAPISPLPTPPAPIHPVNQSPVMHVMPMPPMSAATMSPDDMLRAYAERTLRSPPPLSTPAASYNGSGMRTLYAPAASIIPEAPQPVMLAPSSPESLYPGTPQYAEDAYRQSFAPTEDSRYGDENVEHGTAE